jgi:3-deoxy-alpha-D-manno-octulosonate 8-oxidase
MRPTKTVGVYLFGRGTFDRLGERLEPRRADGAPVCFFVDHVFAGGPVAERLPTRDGDRVFFVDTTHEPSTDLVDSLYAQAQELGRTPGAVVGVGGGSAMDTAKAVSNLLGNGGRAADYQGWDLLARPGVYKIGVPTLSGTGAEASATCVMMNYAKNLKLGMNSIHTVYDELVLDPELTATAPRDQYFFTGQDTYIHCIESLAGGYRHAVADAYSRESLGLTREVFLSGDMQSSENREKLMVASYLGGSAIGNSFVGVVHPLSAGLSVALGVHHCLANCLVMNVMDDFYPEAAAEFRQMLARQGVALPRGLVADATDEQHDRLYRASIIHEKPLCNALGDRFADILTRERVRDLFQRM